MKKAKVFKNASGGLVGAMAIASGTSAYATIINVATPADFTVAPGVANTTANWDVNGDGIFDFTFNYRYPNTPNPTGVIWQANMNPAVGTQATNTVAGYSGPFIRYAQALPSGFSIGSTLAGGNSWSTTATQVTLGSRYRSNGTLNYYGGFTTTVAPGTPAFAGFRFNSGGQTFYGWIQLSVGPGSIDFISAAYENVAGQTILAGAAAVPEPGSLALLALGAAGAAGVVINKRRRS